MRTKEKRETRGWFMKAISHKQSSRLRPRPYKNKFVAVNEYKVKQSKK